MERTALHPPCLLLGLLVLSISAGAADDLGGWLRTASRGAAVSLRGDAEEQEAGVEGNLDQFTMCLRLLVQRPYVTVQM